jgi:hypothetical protein
MQAFFARLKVLHRKLVAQFSFIRVISVIRGLRSHTAALNGRTLCAA